MQLLAQCILPARRVLELAESRCCSPSCRESADTLNMCFVLKGLPNSARVLLDRCERWRQLRIGSCAGEVKSDGPKCTVVCFAVVESAVRLRWGIAPCLFRGTFRQMQRGHFKNFGGWAVKMRQ